MSAEIAELSGPVVLGSEHQTSDFDSSVPALDEFLRKNALSSQRSAVANTFVALRGLRVVGYYSLCAASVEPADAPERFRKGVARHRMPFTLLARLAVDRSEQGHGLGKALLKDACKRFLQASEIVASRGLVTQAKDERARTFYQRYGFEEWPLDSLALFLLTKDIRRTLLGS